MDQLLRTILHTKDLRSAAVFLEVKTVAGLIALGKPAITNLLTQMRIREEQVRVVLGGTPWQFEEAYTVARTWHTQAPERPVLPLERDMWCYRYDQFATDGIERHAEMVFWDYARECWRQVRRTRGATSDYTVWGSPKGDSDDFSADFRMSTVALLSEYQEVRRQDVDFQLSWFHAGLGSSAEMARQLQQASIVV